MSKTSKIKSQDQKLVTLEEEYLPYDRTSVAKIWIKDVQRGFSAISILAKLLHAERCYTFNTDLPLST